LVFHRGGHPMHSTRKLRKEWREACVKAEVAGKLPFHDFRRTAVRNFIRSGVHETVAMSITGHLTRAVFDRYCVTSTADRADALERVQRKPGKVIPLKGGA